MNDKFIDLLRSNEEINLELEDEANAWKRLADACKQLAKSFE